MISTRIQLDYGGCYQYNILYSYEVSIMIAIYLPSAPEGMDTLYKERGFRSSKHF